MPGRLAVSLLLSAAVAVACGNPSVSPAAATVAPSTPPAPATVGPSIPLPATPDVTPSPAASARPTATPAATKTPARTPTPTPSAAGPTPDGFWALVERGLRGAHRLRVDISGPNANAATMRFEPDASATVIEDVVGFVCVDAHAYDGQSAFTAVPGAWTCGAPALVAGFRHIGQPIDAWNSNVPSDESRRETVTTRGNTWTWTYHATSPYLGGKVTATVTLDRGRQRITSARRVDPTGTTRYTFHYGVDFPPIAVPH
jgi:hypothetical protein